MSDYKYSIGYRPVSELISEVRYDLSNYDNFGYIDSYQISRLVLYKMYEIGLRIFQNKEQIVDFRDNHFTLPEFFVTYNFGFVCFGKEVCIQEVCGLTMTTTDIAREGEENKDIFCGEPEPGVFFNKCGGKFELTEKRKKEIFTYKNIKPLVLSNRFYDSGPLYRFCRTCNFKISPLNVGYSFPDKEYLEIHERRIGFLPNVATGTVYINYVSIPYDDERKELLVPDDPIISQFLEYAIKKKVLENVILNNNDLAAAQKMQMVEAGYREYSLKAHSLVNTPNFKEMAEVWKMNRLALENKYYRIFR